MAGLQEMLGSISVPTEDPLKRMHDRFYDSEKPYRFGGILNSKDERDLALALRWDEQGTPEEYLRSKWEMLPERWGGDIREGDIARLISMAMGYAPPQFIPGQ